MAIGIQVVIDCADPGRLAPIWADALGYQIEDPPEGFEAAGATKVRACDLHGEQWTVMADPEGNEFCFQ